MKQIRILDISKKYIFIVFNWGEKMADVKQMPLIIGLVIAIIIGEILGILTSWGDILGYLIGFHICRLYDR